MEQFAEFAYLYDELNVNYDKEKLQTESDSLFAHAEKLSICVAVQAMLLYCFQSAESK